MDLYVRWCESADVLDVWCPKLELCGSLNAIEGLRPALVSVRHGPESRICEDCNRFFLYLSKKPLGRLWMIAVQGLGIVHMYVPICRRFEAGEI